MIKDLFNVKKTYSLIILFLCLLIAHSFYTGGVDDNFFASYFNQLFILNKSNFLIFRFETWSSRIFIEFFLSVLAKFPVLWMILDSLIITIIAILMPNLLISNFKSLEDDKKGLYYLISCNLVMFFLYVNFVSFLAPDFIAGTLNYVWPFSFGLINIFVLKEYILNNNNFSLSKKIRVYFIFVFSFLFSTNMEIMAVVMLLFYMCIIFSIIKNIAGTFFNRLIKVPKILYVFLLLSVIVIFIHLTCPGNAVRFATETTPWLGEYLSLSLFNKIDIGLTSVFYIMLTRFDFMMVYLFFAIIGLYVYIISKNKVISIVCMYPFLIMSLIYLFRMLDDKSNLLFIDFVTKAFKPEMGSAFHGLLGDGISLSVLLIFIIFLTIIVSILISIIVIIKYRNKDIGIQISALILISVASQFVSGNAPSSIMFYPEYPGRYWIIFNGILMIIIGLLIYDLLENWEFSINKLQK